MMIKQKNSCSRWWFGGAGIDFEEEKEKNYWFKVDCGDNKTIKLILEGKK